MFQVEKPIHLVFQWTTAFCSKTSYPIFASVSYLPFYELEHFTWLIQLTCIRKKAQKIYIEKLLSFLRKPIHYYFKIHFIPPSQESKFLSDVIQQNSTDFSEALPILYQ